MWSYYGAKTNIAKLYPAPKHSKIIEPFAGTAKYSLLYFEKDVTLIDKYEKVIGIWKWLQRCSKKDITSLPKIKENESVDDYSWDCPEAKWLVGFNINSGVAYPCKRVSPFMLINGNQKEKLFAIAENIWKIKHWKVILGDYTSIKNQKATWFIDPPYKQGGEHYRHNKIDYKELRKYCLERKGQVIVCENSKSRWLPFKKLKEVNGCYRKSIEMFYERS